MKIDKKQVRVGSWLKKLFFLFSFFFLLSSFVFAQTAPTWVNDLGQAFPDREWVAAVGTGLTRPSAEQVAMNALARAFRTDVASITQASQRFDQIVSESSGKKTVSFDQSQNFSQQVNTTSNIRGLIGVEIDHFQARDGTHYVCARMNRRECSARYTATIRENTAVINRLLTFASGLPAGFESYGALSYAAAIAEVTDNFQNILEVLDPTAVSRRPAYGGANAIKTRMREVAGNITVGIVLETADSTEAVQLTRALASFFTDKGFKTATQGQVNYILRANMRFEPLAFSDRLQSCRYYIDAALERSGRVVFSFTEDSRASHNRADEARRLAVRAAETSVKEGKFAADFDAWLGTLIE